MGRSVENFTAGQAAKIAGIAYRTIDHWARTSLIVPSVSEASGTGSERRYSFDDLIALRVAGELRAVGISVQSLRKMIDFLRHESGLKNPLSGARLVAVGSDVVLVRNCKQLTSLLDKPGQAVFSFMIDLDRTVIEIRKKVEELRAA